MINRPVVRRVGVSLGAGGFENRLALFGRVLLAAAKHQVLEKVRVAALPGFDLVARPGLHDDVKRHQIWIIRRYRDQPQAVRQVVNRVVVSEKLALFLSHGN